LLSFLLAHRFKIIFAGLHPDKIKNELHFGHPLFIGDRMLGVLFQDVFVGSGKRFRPEKTRRRYRNTLSRRRLIQTGPLKCPASLSGAMLVPGFPRK
jgi:hypothetical protein